MTNTWKEGTARDLLRYNGYVWTEFTDPATKEVVSESLVIQPTEFTCDSGEHTYVVVTVHGTTPFFGEVYVLPIDQEIRYSDDWEL